MIITVLRGEEELRRYLAALEPRRCRFERFDVPADPDARQAAWTVLRSAGPARLLLAGAGGGPEVLPLVKAAFGDDTEVHLLVDYLRGEFPPPAGVPPVPARVAPEIAALAMGNPGDPVTHGVMPSPVTKLSRLALAAGGTYEPGELREAAVHAYDPGRPYHAHDAVACAIVHPAIDASGLIERITRPGHGGHGGRGWRSRRKTARIVAWARRLGYAGPLRYCRCAHDRLGVPTSRQGGVHLWYHWINIRDLLEPDGDVYRCTLCGRAWAQSSFTSRDGERYFGYPLSEDERPHDLR